jgi:hypothetical protein
MSEKSEWFIFHQLGYLSDTCTVCKGSTAKFGISYLARFYGCLDNHPISSPQEANTIYFIPMLEEIRDDIMELDCYEPSEEPLPESLLLCMSCANRVIDIVGRYTTDRTSYQDKLGDYKFCYRLDESIEKFKNTKSANKV